MAITSESQVIDITTISNGCSIIEEAARDFTTCSKKVNDAANICTDKALSVEKKSMQPSLQDLAQSIGTIEGNVEYFTSQIRNVAMKIQSRQLQELAEYRAAQAAKQAEAEAAAAQASSNPPAGPHGQGCK